MTVLHLIPTLSLGGAERQLSYLAPSLARLGLEVGVVYVHPGPYLEVLESSGVSLRQIQASRNHSLSVVKGVRRALDNLRPDIVQTWIQMMDIVGGGVATARATPFVLSERSSAKQYTRGPKNTLRNQIAKRASAIVANSAGGRDYWQADRRYSGPLHVVPNAVGEAFLRVGASRPRKKVQSNGFRVLSIGRLDKGKNHRSLIQAAAVSKDPFHLDIYGDGALRPSLQQDIHQLGLSDWVTLCGQTQDVSGLMATYDCFVTTSLFEGFPNVVLEAMAARLPVVVSDIPSHRELLNEQTAIFVDPLSPPSIAQGITACRERTDASAARADASHAEAGRYSAECVARQYIEIYESILSP